MSSAARNTFDPSPLLDGAAYPHPTGPIELVETHMSWVFLTGDYVYKVKKPVVFPFADFSSAVRRRHFCEEELRLNLQFAPSLYLAVLPIVADETLGCRIGSPADSDHAIEWAVQMRQFDRAMQADRLLEDGTLQSREMRSFGTALAGQHAQLAGVRGRYDPAAPIWENFDTIQSTAGGARHQAELQLLRAHVTGQLAALAPLPRARQDQGFVRECHGDLHLSNMVRLENGLHAFDCLEFSPELRNIDCICDAAFLVMDCMVRERQDLAYAFVDGYLNQTGDYRGAALLPLFVDYRSMVRAKVAALRLEQTPDDAAARARLARHIRFCQQQAQRPAGRLYVMNGVTGTGKSYWAEQLTEALGAIRIRSDVLRKVVSGLSVQAQTGSAIGAGIYSNSNSEQLYTTMADCAERLLTVGEQVIIDAACLTRRQRDTIYGAARRAGAPALLLHLSAPHGLLEQRIQSRTARQDDPSEADAAVLSWQLQHQQVPADDEPVVRFDTSELTLAGLLDGITAVRP